MANAWTLGDMSPGRLKGVDSAKRDPEGRLHSLAHVMDVAAWKQAYRRQRAKAAVGVDGVTKAAYGQQAEGTSRACTRG